MSRHVDHNFELLKLLAKAKGKQRQAIINASDSSLVKAVCECAYNLLKGNIKVSTEVKRKLNSKKKHLRDLAAKNVSLKRKREIIQRGGNLLAVLLPPVIESLGRLLFHTRR